MGFIQYLVSRVLGCMYSFSMFESVMEIVFNMR